MEILATAFLSVAIYVILRATVLKKFAERIERPYRWACPECPETFEVSSNNEGVVVQVKTEHLRLRHAES